MLTTTLTAAAIAAGLIGAFGPWKRPALPWSCAAISAGLLIAALAAAW